MCHLSVFIMAVQESQALQGVRWLEVSYSKGATVNLKSNTTSRPPIPPRHFSLHPETPLL